MDVHLEALANHAERIANTVLRVDHEFVRKDMQNFAVFGKRDVARGVHRTADVVALDIAAAMAQRDAAAAIHTTHMASGDADHGGFHGHVGNAFGFLNGAANGANGRVQIDDEAFAQTFGFGRAEREKFHLLLIDFRNQGTCFRAAYVQPNDVPVFLCQAAAPNCQDFCTAKLLSRNPTNALMLQLC